MWVDAIILRFVQNVISKAEVFYTLTIFLGSLDGRFLLEDDPNLEKGEIAG